MLILFILVNCKTPISNTIGDYEKYKRSGYK